MYLESLRNIPLWSHRAIREDRAIGIGREFLCAILLSILTADMSYDCILCYAPSVIVSEMYFCVLYPFINFPLFFFSSRCIITDSTKKESSGREEKEENEHRESPSTSVPEPNNNDSESSTAPRGGGQHRQQQQQQHKPSALDNFNGLAASFISPFRPGRLAPIEILLRLFPTQRKAVLELVLQGCSGDLVKAIEHFLSAQSDGGGPGAPSSLAGLSGHHHGEVKHDHGFSVSGLLPAGLRSPFGNADKHAMGSLKSAFSPLPPSSVASSLPLLFAPRAPHPFTADALLGRSHPLFSPSSVAEHLSSAAAAGHHPGASARFAFPGLHPLNLSGKFPTPGDTYPRLIFAPYGASAASCPPDCVQCPGPRHSVAGSESEKSPSATTEGSLANSNVDSD